MKVEGYFSLTNVVVRFETAHYNKLKEKLGDKDISKVLKQLACMIIDGQIQVSAKEDTSDE